MTSFKEYIAYFEGLANQFLANTETNKTFYRKGLDEYLNNLTTDGNFPCMLISSYDFKYEDNGADSVQKKRTVAFIVTDHVDDIDDYDAIDTAMDTCEEKIDFIYNQIRIDRKDPLYSNFLQYADLKNVQVTPVANYSEGNYGFYVTIDVYSHHNTSILS